jgi:putative FmdB family regulatory protein
MPFYDYKCKDCGKTFEIEKGMNEKAHPKCPHCKSSKTSRKFSAPRRMPSKSDYLDHEGSEQSGSCSSCSSGVCSTCNTKGS